MVKDYLQDQILEKLNALVVVLDNNGNAEYVSESAAALLGYSSSDLMGTNWFDVTRFSRPEGERTRKKIMSLMKNNAERSQTFEHEFRTSAGAKKYIRWNVSNFDEESIIGVGYDVTEQKIQEQKLVERNKILQQQNKEIKDSIFYAKRIQESILQSPEYIKSIFRDCFVLYKPKDIVSGDFYYFFEDAENKFAIVVDCTGHGVPGAMMSMMANSIIKEVLLNKKIRNVSEILYELDKELYKSVNSYSNEANSDGMDAAVIRVSKKTNRLHFAGAFRPLSILRKGQVLEMRASRFPLGFYSDVQKVFEEQVLLLEKGDHVFMFTDGFIDQFGGGQNKKLNRKNFRELLKLAAEMQWEEQEAFLEYSLNNWKQEEEQTDDILVVGIKV